MKWKSVAASFKFDVLVRKPYTACYTFCSAAFSSPDLTDPVQFLRSVDKSGIQPDSTTYSRLIQACSRSRNLAQARDVHAHFAKSGVTPTVILEDQIVDMYVKCGSLEDARLVFNRMVDHWDLVSWTRMISSCAQLGQPEEAHGLFQRMQLQGVLPDKVALIAALSACDCPSWLLTGLGIHTRIVQAGWETDVVVSNALVNMYGKCGDVKSARQMFEEVPRQDVISWNGMISVYVQKGLGLEAVELFRRMHLEGVRPSRVSFITVLGTVSALAEGKRIHVQVVDTGYAGEVTIGNALIDMYGRCRSIRDARRAFDSILDKNVVSWTSLIAATVQSGLCKDALVISKEMLQEGMVPNKVSFLAMLDACATLNAFCMSSPEAVFGDLREARLVHSLAAESGLELNLAVASALVYVYSKCASLELSREVFSRVNEPDMVLRTAMIAAYAQVGDYKESFELYQEMQDVGLVPDKVVFLSLLNGCGTPQALAYGKLAHSQLAKLGYEGDVSVGNALVHMYGKCCNVVDARKVFDRMMNRDIVSWTTMIAVYAEHGWDVEALEIFKQMQVESVTPDKVTIINILDAFANLSGLAQGRLIHREVTESRYFSLDLILGNAVARMYGNCGSVVEARQVFDSMTDKDIVSWNCLLTSYAQHGFVEESLQLFRKMHEDCVKPDEVTFVGVLSACSHGGLIADGCRFFVSMVQDYGVVPGEIHYGCMVDLLGRAGRLAEAEELIGKLPFCANEIIWTTLLSASKVHTDLERGKLAARKLTALVPGDSTPMLVLASIYSVTGQTAEAERIREEVKVSKKSAVCRSWIEVNSQVREFVAGERMHGQPEGVYDEVDRLERLMKEGQAETPSERSDRQRKEYHSEKLAVSFGLLNTPDGAALRVKTSSRICSDCHTACKFISRTANRTIMVKDARGFHHFRNGSCSCKEYW